MVSEAMPQAMEGVFRQSSLGDQVYDILWRRITGGELRPGTKLSDVHLSAALGVSRTPVREALHRLAQDGIVRTESRSGFFVASFSARDIREGYEVRGALEVLAVRLALPHLTDGDLDAAQHALDAVHPLVAADDPRAGERLLTADRDFHRLLATHADNGRLQAMLAALHTQIGVFQVYGIHRTREALEHTIRSHRAILDALVQRDADAAAAAMAAHIRKAGGSIVALLEERERATETDTAPA